jgi:UDP-GlcNAc:undecaprenyl-phosphate GlcNAc-1-phosphate transferase
MIFTAVSIFVAAFVLSFGATLVLRKIAPRLGLVDRPASRKLHSHPMPLGGGIAIFLGVTIVVAAGAIALPAIDGRVEWLPEVVKQNIDLMSDKLPTLLAVMGGSAVIMLVGLCDDIRGLPPWVRLAVEVAVAAGLFVLSPELRLTVFTPWTLTSFIYTVLWITAITNAFNLLDNMDGLSSGVACVAGLIFLIVAAQTGQLFVAALLLALIGATLGFLVFNFPPASIFMGDAGALFIGYMISVLTVVFTFYGPSPEKSPLLSMLLPVVILAVPLFDTLSVVVIRIRSGRPVFLADKNHFSHRLTALGMSPKQAVLTIYLVTFCTGIGAAFWHRVSTVGSLLIFTQAAAIIGLIIILEITAAKKQIEAED